MSHTTYGTYSPADLTKSSLLLKIPQFFASLMFRPVAETTGDPSYGRA